jgi:hypothetical protein
MGLGRRIMRTAWLHDSRLRWLCWRYGRDLADLRWLASSGGHGDFLIPLQSGSRMHLHVGRLGLSGSQEPSPPVC